MFRCKPLDGVGLIDILGQTRTTEETKMYFATDNKILVNTAEDNIQVFDEYGYIQHEECFKEK